MNYYRECSIRDLIKELGSERTVILSTHILPEVEIVCNRVIIINRGKIVAMDSVDKLTKTDAGVRIKLEVRGLGVDIQKVLEGMPEITSVEGGTTDNISEFVVIANNDVREKIAEKLAEHKYFVRELKLEKVSLEDIFIKVTTEE